MSAQKKTAPFRSLAVTLAISFSVLIIVVLLVGSSLQMYFSFHVQQNYILQNQKLIAENTANTVENFIREKIGILETTVKRRNLIVLPEQEQEAILERLMGLEPAFRQLALFKDPKTELQKVSRISDTVSSQLMNYSRDELFHIVSQNENYIGPVYIDEITSEPMMIMAVPVTDIFGDYKGILIAETNLKFMWDLMDQIKIGRNGQAYVVEKQGYLIAYRDISRVLKRENLNYLREVALFVKEKEATHEISAEISKGILGRSVMTAQVPLETPNWAVIVELPIMEAYQSMIRTLGLSVLVMLSSILIAIFLGVFLSRRLTKPIIELRDAAEKIGRGHLSLKIDIDANNEIGDLADSFNRMVKDLKNTTVSKNALLAEVNERKQAESESKRLQSELLRAQKMEVVGTLAAGVAHDLNNILSGIVSYPELILMDMSEENPLKAPLLTIKKAGERAAAIVQDLLTLARRGVATTEVLNLNDIIPEFLKSPEYENLLSFHRDITVEVNLDKSLFNIKGSPANLSKVLMNLISNAAESMPDGGAISLSTLNQYLDKPVSGYENIDAGEYVVLTVSDTGGGMSKTDLLKIFEPFYTKKKMGRSGTGLGMTVVWGTVKDHDGYIDIESKEAEGTTCTLYFPVCREEIFEKKASIPIDQYAAKGESILVVDDVEEQRIIITQILKKLGYKVASVSSGEEALNYMNSNSADLLVLDMIMDPGINGLETYKRILKLNPNQKAIIASGFSETEHVKEALRLGAGAYVKKPYSFEKIGRAIREELDK